MMYRGDIEITDTKEQPPHYINPRNISHGQMPFDISMHSQQHLGFPPYIAIETESVSNLKLSISNKPAQKKKFKATNIPKFLLKVFSNNLPFRITPAHKIRLKMFLKGLSQSKTRFDLVQLFGPSENQQKNEQNRLNRQALKRLLTRNYDNILQNKHIRNKRLYLLFCKKIIFRLDHPTIIDRLEV